MTTTTLPQNQYRDRNGNVRTIAIRHQIAARRLAERMDAKQGKKA